MQVNYCLIRGPIVRQSGIHQRAFLELQVSSGIELRVVTGRERASDVLSEYRCGPDQTRARGAGSMLP